MSAPDRRPTWDVSNRRRGTTADRVLFVLALIPVTILVILVFR